MKRCVNLDWLEVYCLESRNRFPCNADYFRDNGWFVREREYGTRVWREMFVLEDIDGEPYIEIRRNPSSGEADINGLMPESCHIRFNNRACYYTDAIDRLRRFIIENEYIYKRIFRLDICYDFRLFDSGDRPDLFVKRLLECKYRKVNQGKISAVGDDTWTNYDWESLSWGSRHSMISTKMYCKSKELASAKRDKPYIRRLWFEAGIVADPEGLFYVDIDGSLKQAEIWRIEFSLKSGIDGYIIYEDINFKKTRKQRLEHTLDLYDNPEKLWNRFEELAWHYFHFKYYEEGRRKDRCKDKVLFHFNTDREFLQVTRLPRQSKPVQLDVQLRRKLELYKEIHVDHTIRQACDVLLKNLSRTEIRRLTTDNNRFEIEALQRAIARKMGGDPTDAAVLIARIRELLETDSIF